MDETELRELLDARARRGTVRGVDALIDAVELELPAPRRTDRRRERVILTLAFAAVLAVAVLVVGARSTGREHVTPVRRGDVAPTATVTTVSPSTTAALATPAETIGSIHPIDAHTAWLVTNRRVMVTDDRGATWSTVLDVDIAAAAFTSPNDGVYAFFRDGRLYAGAIENRHPVGTADLGPMVVFPSVHITHAPDQFVLWEVSKCHGSEPCRTQIWTNPGATSEWTPRYDGDPVDGIRCTRLGTCWGVRTRLDAAGLPQRAFVTSSDSGGSWHPYPAAIPTEGGYAAAVSIITASGSTFAYEVDDVPPVPGGGDSESTVPVFMISRDSGHTFTRRVWPSQRVAPMNPSRPFLFAVRHADGSWTALVGRDVVAARDDTLQWRVIQQLPFDVGFARWSDAYTAWITNFEQTRMAYTLDAGHSWHVVDLPRD